MNKRILTPLFFTIIAGLVYFIFTSPKLSDAMDVRENLNFLTDTFDRSEEISTIRDTLIGEYSAISVSDREKILKSIPNFSEDQILLFIQELEFLTKKDGRLISIAPYSLDLSLNQNSFDSGENGFGFVSYSFSLSMEYEDLQDFLRDLENSLRIIDIIDITYSPNREEVVEEEGEGDEEGNVIVIDQRDEVTMTFRTYFKQ